jgi:hypothetical protein
MGFYEELDGNEGSSATRKLQYLLFCDVISRRAHSIRGFFGLVFGFSGLWESFLYSDLTYDCGIDRSLGSKPCRAYLGAIWLLLSVTVLIWMLFAAHKVALNFAALLAFVCGGLSFVASYILLFSKKFKAEYARQEKLQPHYKRTLRRGLIALIILLFVVAILHDIYHLFSA